MFNENSNENLINLSNSFFSNNPESDFASNSACVFSYNSDFYNFEKIKKIIFDFYKNKNNNKYNNKNKGFLRKEKNKENKYENNYEIKLARNINKDNKDNKDNDNNNKFLKEKEIKKENSINDNDNDNNNNNNENINFNYDLNYDLNYLNEFEFEEDLNNPWNLEDLENNFFYFSNKVNKKLNIIK
jgi:hypothetical protein